NESMGVWLSTDNMATWTQLRSSGMVMGINASNDLFIGDNGVLYRRTAASDYVTETAVLPLESGVQWRYQSWAIDDANNLYAGAYQSDFNARLYKSTNDGANWSLILTDGGQHVHS